VIGGHADVAADGGCERGDAIGIVDETFGGHAATADQR